MLLSTKIDHFHVEDVTISEAIEALRLEWKKTTATDLPAYEIHWLDYDDPPRLTLETRDASAYRILVTLCVMADCRIKYLDDGTMISYDDYTYDGVKLNLTKRVKSALGLGSQPTENDVRAALALRGLSVSELNLKIRFTSENGIVVMGGEKTVELIEALVWFAENGFVILEADKVETEK